MKVIGPGDVEIDLGTVEATPTVGITDFSRRVTDDFGVTTVVERGFARRMSVRFALPFDDVDDVQRSLAALRAVPSQWIADEDYDWLNFEGIFKDFEMDLALPPLSFCTLTVEGLAETETVPDAGEDPAPDGSVSTLLLLHPVTVAGAALVSSNVPENDWPEWSNVTVYPVGAKVIKAATHRIYESLAATNVANDPAGVSGKWLDVGPTNRWAMFDEALGTKTSRATSIAVTINAGAVDALALLDVVGSTVRVQTTGYDQTKAVSAGAVTFLDLPGASANVTVTITGTGTVSAGTLLIGELMKLGITAESPTAGITDYSRKDVDDFGEVTIVERAWAKRMTARAMIDREALDIVANRIAAVRARPCLWIADDGTDALTIWGFFKDFSIEVGETINTLSLTVEGLSEAMQLAEDFDGLSIVEKTIYRRSASAPATPTGGSFNFETMAATPPVGWSNSVPAGTDPVYVSDGIASKEGPGGTAAFGAWSPPVIGFINGADGTAGSPGSPGSPGAAGTNNAVVYLYRRGATSPAVPTGTFTFTFSTGVLSGGTLNGWTQAIPAADGNPLWVIAAAASATTATDSIAAAEFTEPVLKDGAGLNAATVFLYQRAASAPSVPGATTTYTFATGVLAGTLGSWTQTVPAHNGNPLYVITATALAATATDTIATGEWSAVRVLAENGAAGAAGTAGAPGAPGANGTTYYTWYAYADHPSGLFNFTNGAPGSRVFQGIATGKTTATESTNPADYDWSPYIGPPNFGLVATNTVVAGNKIIKTAVTGSWDASIHSTESFKGGASVSWVVDDATRLCMIGLNTDPTTDANYSSIDFCLYMAGSDVVVYQGGSAIASGYGAPVNGDVFTVTYNNKTVVYSRNGVPFYTNNSPTANLTLFLDSSIATPSCQPARILSFTAAGTAGVDGAAGTAGAPGAPGANGVTYYTWYAYADSSDGIVNFSTGNPGDRTFQGIAYNKTTATESTNPADYAWTPYQGPPSFGLANFDVRTVIAGNKVIKRGAPFAGDGWDGSIHSTESYRGGATVSFVVQVLNKDWMVGLNTDPTTGSSYNTIDFCIYPRGDNKFQVYEGGGPVYVSVVDYAIGDVFTVTYNNKTVTYSRNGTVFYTNSSPAANLTLFLDTSLHSSATTFGYISSFTGVGTAGDNGISPVLATASPAAKQFTADSDGVIKAGQLDFPVSVTATKAGSAITGTITVIAVSGCTATATSGGFDINTVTADSGYVNWRFTASDGQIVEGRMTLSRQRDPTGGGEVLVNFSSTSWYGSGSYGASGPTTTLSASATGKLKLTGFASFFAATNGSSTITGKLQYRAVGSGTWIDAGISGSGVATRTIGVPGEPNDNTPGVINISGNLTGLTANGSYEMQLVGSRTGNTVASATGYVALKQVP